MKLIRADYIMLTAFIMMLAVHSTTHYLISTHTSFAETQAEAKAIVQYVEKNPLAAYIIYSKNLTYIYSYIVVPSLFWGFYYFLRCKYYHKQEVLEMVAVMASSMFFINFMNDFTYLLAYLIG